MAVKIEIPQSDVEPLREFYANKRVANQQKLEELHEEVAKAVAEDKRLERMIRYLEAANDFEPGFDLDAPMDTDEYKELLTWEEKLKFALNKLEKTATTGEIVEFLADYEPSVRDKSRSLSAILSDGIKDGKFYKEKEGGGYAKYGLAEWLPPIQVPRFESSDDLPF